MNLAEDLIYYLETAGTGVARPFRKANWGGSPHSRLKTHSLAPPSRVLFGAATGTFRELADTPLMGAAGVCGTRIQRGPSVGVRGFESCLIFSWHERRDCGASHSRFARLSEYFEPLIRNSGFVGSGAVQVVSSVLCRQIF